MTSRRLAAAALVAITLTVLGPRPAAAAEVSGAGWWTSTPVAVAPDGQDGLVVQGGPQADKPESYAAVSFTLAPTEAPAKLHLAVAPGSVSTATSTLAVCALQGSFEPAEGGAMADAPAYDCAAKVTAEAVDGTYTFDLASFTGQGALAVAVLPGAASDRVVLAKPGADALETTSSSSASVAGSSSDASSGADPTFDSGASSFDSGSSDVSSVAPSTGSFDLPAIDVPTSDAPTVDASAPSATAASPQSSADAAEADEGSAPNTGGGGSPIGPIAFVCLAAVAVGLWAAASRMADGTGVLPEVEA